MPAELLVYGATGYMGKLIARMARDWGLRPILGARNAAKLKPLADSLGFAYRVVQLDDASALAATLSDVHTVLNAAGPFSVTSRLVIDACLRTGAHYLDITGEIPVFEALHRRDAEARARGVMIMPGVGFIVVPSDCLAAHAARLLRGAQRLTLAVSRSTLLSRGSARTIGDLWTDTIWTRRDGVMTPLPAGQLERQLDYGAGARVSTAVSWGDVFTAFHTTGIPNITVYHEVSPAERTVFRLSRQLGPLFDTAPWRRLFRIQTDLLPEGPSDAQRRADRRVIVAEAEDDRGQRVRARLTTPDAYTFTAVTALTVAQRVVNGDFASGFQTPGRLYGADFVLSCDGAVREDVEAPTATPSVARSRPRPDPTSVTPSDRRSVLAFGSRLETAVPAAVLLGHMWWYASAVLYPARTLKSVGLYRSPEIGRRPTGVSVKGEGPFYCHRYGDDPVYLSTERARDDSIAYFDLISTIYATYMQPFTHPLFEEAMSLMKPLISSNARLLDTSCGPGTEALRLARLVPDGEVVGMDLSAGMVATAHEAARRRGIRNLAFFQADVGHMPDHFTGRFDATFCFGAFHHYPDPHRAVREMHRVLNERGIAFVVDPGPAWIKVLASPLAQWADPGWVGFHTGEEFQELFVEAGFAQFYWNELLPGFGMCIAAKCGVGP